MDVPSMSCTEDIVFYQVSSFSGPYNHSSFFSVMLPEFHDTPLRAVLDVVICSLYLGQSGSL